MNTREVRLLCLDDSPDTASGIADLLRQAGYLPNVEQVASAASLAAEMEGRQWDAVLAEPALAGFDLSAIIAVIRRRHPSLPVILFARAAGDADVARFLRLGARDIVLKSQPARLVPVVERELAVARDEIELRDLRASRDEMRARDRAFFEESTVAMAECQGGMHVRANRAWLELFGYDSFEELAHVPLLDLVERTDQLRVRHHFHRAARAGRDSTRLELVAVRRDGVRVAVEWLLSSTDTEAGQLTHLIARNVSASRNAESRLRFLAERDPLTGLFNRPYFLRELARRVGPERTAPDAGGLLIAEIRAFKDLVREHGYAAADRLTLNFSRVLAQELADTDVAARLADDEFAVLCGPDGADSVQERLATLESRLRVYTFTEGHARYDARVNVWRLVLDPTLESLNAVFAALRPAESPIQLVRADAAGETVEPLTKRVANRTAPASRRDSSEDSRIADALRDHGLRVYFQPIVNLHEESAHWYEARAGLPDAAGALDASPRLNRALRLGAHAAAVERWLVTTAIRHLHNAREAGRDIAILIATSDHAALAPVVEASLRHHGVPGDRLLVALRSAALALDHDRATAIVTALSRVGCRIVLDDFESDAGVLPPGVMAAVAQIRVDYEHIDQLLNQDHDRAAADRIFTAANWTDKPVIVRNVAHATQLAELWRYGIARVQGDYFQPFTPKAEYELRAEHVEGEEAISGWRGT
jgi:diguanylate cyclase (GGDEF)-like protein/PAS domain S-box-containing protein